MDVPAHHSVIAEARGVASGELLELFDVAQARADAQLQPLCERPVGTAECAAHVVQMVIHTDGHAVQQVADPAQPPRAYHRIIELIAVQHQQPLTAHGAMHPFAMDLELAAQHLREHAEARVVIARYVDEARARALPREQGSQHLGMRGRPESPPREAQRVDDVADQHDALGLDALQELVQFPRPRVRESEMNVRQEQRAYARSAASYRLTARHAGHVLVALRFAH